MSAVRNVSRKSDFYHILENNPGRLVFAEFRLTAKSRPSYEFTWSAQRLLYTENVFVSLGHEIGDAYWNPPEIGDVSCNVPGLEMMLMPMSFVPPLYIAFKDGNEVIRFPCPEDDSLFQWMTRLIYLNDMERKSRVKKLKN